MLLTCILSWMCVLVLSSNETPIVVTDVVPSKRIEGFELKTDKKLPVYNELTYANTFYDVSLSGDPQEYAGIPKHNICTFVYSKASQISTQEEQDLRDSAMETPTPSKSLSPKRILEVMSDGECLQVPKAESRNDSARSKSEQSYYLPSSLLLSSSTLGTSMGDDEKYSAEDSTVKNTPDITPSSTSNNISKTNSFEKDDSKLHSAATTTVSQHSKTSASINTPKKKVSFCPCFGKGKSSESMTIPPIKTSATFSKDDRDDFTESVNIYPAYKSNQVPKDMSFERHDHG